MIFFKILKFYLKIGYRTNERLVYHWSKFFNNFDNILIVSMHNQWDIWWVSTISYLSNLLLVIIIILILANFSDQNSAYDNIFGFLIIKKDKITIFKTRLFFKSIYEYFWFFIFQIFHFKNQITFWKFQRLL